jgi:hypothetical protein
VSDWAQCDTGDVIGMAGDDVQSLSGDLPGSGDGQNMQPTTQNAGSSGVLPGGPSLPGNDAGPGSAVPDPGGSNGGDQNLQPLAQNGPSGGGGVLGGGPPGPPTPFIDKYATQPAPHNPQELLNELVGDAPAGPSVVMEMDVDAVLKAVQDYEREIEALRPMVREAENVRAVEPPGEEEASYGFVDANRPPAESLKAAVQAQIKILEQRKQAFYDSAHAVRKVDEQGAESLRMRE